MLAFARRKADAALAWLLIVPVWIGRKRKAFFRGAILLSAVFAGFVLVAPMNFAVREGDLSYQLAKGSLDGGRVQIPLGPIGWVNLKTHAVPINLKLNLVVDRNSLTTGQDLPGRVRSGAKTFTYDATDAFWWFMVTRIALFAWIGICLGITVSNGGHNCWNRRLARNVLIGFVGFLVLAGSLIGISYLTLNRTDPEIEYVGVVKDLRKGLVAAMVIGKGYSLDKNWLQNLIDGAAIVAGQISEPSIDTGTSILCASDFQGNAAGMKLVDGIVQSKGNISAVILAGDIVQTGSYFDTYLFRNSLTFDKTKIPVWYVDGNHEDQPSDYALRQDLGFKRLDEQMATVGNLTITGESDPDGLDIGLEPSDEELQNSSVDLLWKWQNFATKPDVIVVHELAQAKDVIAAAKASDQPLTVIYGHDHLVGHSFDGSVNLVDSGTGGAWGFDKISEDPKTPYTFHILDFSEGPTPRLTGIWTLQFYGLNDGTSVRYYPIK
jgi:predicted phosphodiesterase